MHQWRQPFLVYSKWIHQNNTLTCSVWWALGQNVYCGHWWMSPLQRKHILAKPFCPRRWHPWSKLCCHGDNHKQQQIEVSGFKRPLLLSSDENSLFLLMWSYSFMSFQTSITISEFKTCRTLKLWICHFTFNVGCSICRREKEKCHVCFSLYIV